MALDGYIIRPDGSQAWYLNDQLHRIDGPAIIRSNGYQAWYLKGQIHREDGPAVVWPDGSQEWYLNNRFHRNDGPARIWSNGTQAWYLNGKELSEELFLKLTKEPIDELPLYLGLGFDTCIAERLNNL